MNVFLAILWKDLVTEWRSRDRAVAMGLFAMLAVAVSGVADLVQQPVVPLSLVAALAIATAHELRERVSHVNAS